MFLAPFVLGDDSLVPEKAGQRTDTLQLHNNLQRVVRGEMQRGEIPDLHFDLYLKYHRGIENYFSSRIRHRENKPPRIFIFWGESGSGKSSKAFEMFPNAYRKMVDNWWQEYSGETEILFDDFYGWMKFDEILRICDRYRHKVQYKGGGCPLTADTLIFTSNVWWEDWWDWEKVRGRKEAFARRVAEFGDQWEEPYPVCRGRLVEQRIFHMMGRRGAVPVVQPPAISPPPRQMSDIVANAIRAQDEIDMMDY